MLRMVAHKFTPTTTTRSNNTRASWTLHRRHLYKTARPPLGLPTSNNNNNNNSNTNTSNNNTPKGGDYWSASQDLALQVAVSKHGPNWAKVTATVGGDKSAMKCKLRWKYLMQTWRQDTPHDKEVKLQGSLSLVGVAMASNLTLCVAKFGAAMHTGSSSLFAESIHSFMDMINQALLMIGIKRSMRSPDLEHPYGFHREQYAWASISAVGILFVGGGVPIATGVYSLVHPSTSLAVMSSGDMRVAMGVLGLAFVCEGFTATRALLQVRHLADRAGVSVREYIASGSDPASVQVLLEDSSSVIGSMIAASALGMTWYAGLSAFDAMGSVAIGSLLSGVAVYLLRRNMKMVLESSMGADKLRQVTRIIASDPVVASIQDIKSSSLGPEQARFKAEISFNNYELTRRYLQYREINLADELESIKQFKHPGELNEYLGKFGNGLVNQLGDEIDRIEQNIRDVAPEVKHVDLEVL